MLVAVLSVKGSPGVTTFSVALIARWPSPSRALLVEADPSGGDVGTRFSLESAPGLVSLAVAARRSDDPALPWQHAQALPGGLAVVAAPPDADRARAAVSALTDPATSTGVLRSAASSPDAVMIVDCGRIDAESPAMPIVRSADAMVLLTRAHADDLAHLARRLPVIGRWTPHPAMLLVGEGYSTADVARDLGVAALGRVPDDPHGAAVLCGRPSTPRWGRSGPAHSAVGQVAHTTAKALLAKGAPSPALRRPAPADQSVQTLRAVPGVHGVPASPVSTDGPRPAPAPLPPNTESTSRGGRAS